MGKGIYSYYKERLIEIGGNNKCLYLKNIVRRSAYDLGRIFEGRDNKVGELIDFLWSGGKYPITLISNKEKKDILQNLDIETKFEKKAATLSTLTGEEAEKFQKKLEREKREESNKAIELEITKLKELKREIDELEKETGRYELYIGFPFVFGMISQGFNKTPIKAPLLLFPVKIDIPDDSTVELSINEAEKIRINPALVFAYAQSKKINIDNLDLEFDSMQQFKTVGAVADYLQQNHVKIEMTDSKNIYEYSKFKEPDDRDLSVRYAAVLARFPLSNSIYNDYSALEKKNLVNDAVNELLRMSSKKIKPKKKAKKTKPSNCYAVKMLDYAQSEVVKKVSEMGNMVIYGPPGTGKSQTIVNIITDSISKHKKVLVVSQKKAALDVVFNRLGTLNSKAMYINDECKEKRNFYDKCLNAHNNDIVESLIDLEGLENEYNALEEKINSDIQILDRIQNILTTTLPFGLSLSDMYSSSYMLSKTSSDYAIYEKLIGRSEIMALNYKELSDALFAINAKNLDNIYYNFIEDKKNNPLIDYMQPDIDIRTLSEVKGLLEEVQKSRKGYFNIAKYPYYRHVMAHYHELCQEDNLDMIVKQEAKFKHPDKLFRKKYEDEIKATFLDTMDAIETFVKEYDCLHRVLSEDGYIAVIDNIIRGNTSYIKLVYDALDNYIALRDVNKLIENLDKNMINILNFAYAVSKNYQNYTEVLSKIMLLRIYHEVLKYEEAYKNDLAVLVDFQNITSRIYKMKEQQLDIAYKLTSGKNSREYEQMFNSSKDNRDYLYQISKKQKYWPIRKTMEIYGKYILSLFPCWLLSPENASSLLPLEKNMFDIVIFDEASQVFIESTIPTIYRGKNIVVAGDAKQLRPSTTFMKRYLGADPDTKEDYSVQAALEVESLLDLAVARYDSANLTYHYRSRYSELIDFSNVAFYDSKLQIAPNISKNKANRPIVRYKVNGKWIDRRNVAEAAKIVEILKEFASKDRTDESIGIITFNTDQQTCIADAIDNEAAKNPEFRSYMLKQTHRTENGEDESLFIKNLENVQGDERDIIIFSIGYAQNQEGKIYTNFGSLSVEGGENRLNVAITRAKNKIIVVTSIEPEDLKVEASKHLGPKLLKKYLMYVRAVSTQNTDEINAIFSELDTTEKTSEPKIINCLDSIESRIKERLEKLGYNVDLNLGNKNNRISLAVYDESQDKYLVGVELEKDAFLASSSSLERDVYKPVFLEKRGWNIIRVWSRDWWLYPTKVIKSITALADKAKSKVKSARRIQIKPSEQKSVL